MKRQYAWPLRLALIAICAVSIGAFTAHNAAPLTVSTRCLQGFVPSSKGSPTRCQGPASNRVEASIRRLLNKHRTSSSALCMGGNIFDDIQKFFAGDSNGDDESNDSNDTADDFNSENRIATIPVKAIKPGGLRLFLMFYLMGMQNTPDRMSWKADQPTRDEYVIDYYYHDRTAMLTIELGEEHITIDRIGAVPSNAYMLQETVIVGGILDELHQCAFDDDIEEENRLLELSEPKDAIEQARAALAFG